MAAVVGRTLDFRSKFPVDHLRANVGSNSPTSRSQTSSVWNKILRLADGEHPYGEYTHVCVHEMIDAETEDVMCCNTVIKCARGRKDKQKTPVGWATSKALDHLKTHADDPSATKSAQKAATQQRSITNLMGGVTKMNWELTAVTLLVK